MEGKALGRAGNRYGRGMGGGQMAKLLLQGFFVWFVFRFCLFLVVFQVFLVSDKK